MSLPVAEILRKRWDSVMNLQKTVSEPPDRIQRAWFTKGNLATMPTVVASADFGRYVGAMAAKWPEGEFLSWPTLAECRWPFPDQGVLILWEEPYANELWITTDATGHPVPYGLEVSTLATFVLDPHHTVQPAVRSKIDGQRVELAAQEMSFQWNLHDDGSMTTSYWAWGGGVRRHEAEDPTISKSARFNRALVEAMGHRLAALEPASTTGLSRHDRRALARADVGEFRTLGLRTPQRPTPRGDGTRKVEWTKRWGVRGHWRDQACGPGWKERRTIWIDPFIKGPDDKPLDIRPDLFLVDE